mmetsp:Transcript_14701/g.57680  ORF Transcript_14701/g.57680 Transcript_14701/m.57680 type:complete len:888 (-) Transcript_14701:42-2705(-)
MAAPHSSGADAAQRFMQLCTRLKMDPSFAEGAWEVVERVSPLVEMKREDEPFWFACGILTCVMACKLEKLDAGLALPTLSDVLQQANVRLVDVFEPMQSFVDLAKPTQSEKIKKEMDLLARRFIVMSLFTKKYRDMFSTLLTYPQKNGTSSEYSFGWLLFLSAKGDLLANSTDVVHLLNVLLCCMNLVFVLSAPENRKRQIAEGEEEALGIALLANLYSANCETLTTMYKTQFLPYMKLMCDDGALRFQAEGSTATLSEPLDTKQLQGLMEEELMERNVVQLRKQYKDRLQHMFSINELTLLETPEEIGTPSKMPPKLKQYYDYQAPSSSVEQKEKVGEKSPTGPRSPVTPRTIRVTIPATPVTSTMQTLGWLERVVTNQGDGPSRALTAFFKACKSDPTDSITGRVETVTSSVDFDGEQGKSSAARRQQAAKLYYRLLEAMLTAEEQRLHTKDFAVLLSQDMFHRSLIACCMEITAYCYKQDQLRYPYIPTQLSIEPFEYCKIIENVLRHEVTIPLVLKRHLMRIEEQILEEDAWKAESSLFGLLQQAGQQEHIYQQFHVSGSQTAAGDSPARRGAPVAASPRTALTPSRLRRRAAAPLHSPAPTRTSGGSTPAGPRRSRSLELFFRKVLSLANVRMQLLFKRMEIAAGIYHHLWFSFVHALIWFPEIIKDRHLDQIIMCTLYGVCRANKLENVTFRKILDGYRHQPQASSTLWRSVLLQNGERGDIIKFYNSVFITLLEDVLWKYQGRVPQAQASFAPPASPMKVAPRYNLYLSPLKGTKFATSTAAGGAIRYNIGKSPAAELTDINKNMTTGVGTKRKASRKLDFTAVAGSEAKRQRTEEITEAVDGPVSTGNEDVEMADSSTAGRSKRKARKPAARKAKAAVA